MKVAVLGLGRVGLPTACYFASIGHEVRGYDVGRDLISQLRNKVKPFPFEPEVDVSTIYVGETLDAVLSGADVVYIIVPSPSVNGVITGDIVGIALVQCHNLRPEMPVVIGTTLGPRDALNFCRRGGVYYNPPLIRLGHVVEDHRNAKLKLAGGLQLIGMHDFKILFDLWQWNLLDGEYFFGSPDEVAMVKLGINASLSMRIGWANEIAEVCELNDVDAKRVLAGIGLDSRIGTTYMHPGWSPAGPCLPRDLEMWKYLGRQDKGLTCALSVSHWVRRMRCVQDVLDEIEHSGIDKPRIAVLGLMYNPSAIDRTDSQGDALMLIFKGRGWECISFDPALAAMPEKIPDVDFVVIATAWPQFKSMTFPPKAKIIDLVGLL